MMTRRPGAPLMAAAVPANFKQMSFVKPSIMWFGAITKLIKRARICFCPITGSVKPQAPAQHFTCCAVREVIDADGSIDVDSSELEAPETPFKTRLRQRANPRLARCFTAVTVGGGPAKSRLLSDNTEAWNARWDMLSKATTRHRYELFQPRARRYGMGLPRHIMRR